MIAMAYAFSSLLLVAMVLVSSVFLFKLFEKENKTKETIALFLMGILFILNYPNVEKYQVDKAVKIKCETLKQVQNCIKGEK